MGNQRKSSSPVILNSSDEPRRPKRKQNFVIISSDDEVDDSHSSSSLGEDEWYINCILDETESHYLIDWEGDWSPSWEPKENASNTAVQTWEEKKRQGSLKPRGSIEIQQGESSIRRSGLPEQDSEREDSPLFISLEAVSETPQVEVASEVSDTSDLEQLPEPARLVSIDSAAYFELSSPSPPPSDIFGYTPKFVIPTEYQLPEEIPNTYPTQNQPNNPRFYVSPTTERQVSNSDGVIAFESTKESGKPEPATISANRTKEVDEIAETPGHSATGPSSVL